MLVVDASVVLNRSPSLGAEVSGRLAAARASWEFGRRRLVQLAGRREIIVHGSEEERRALVASLREVDFVPLPLDPGRG